MLDTHKRKAISVTALRQTLHFHRDDDDDGDGDIDTAPAGGAQGLSQHGGLDDNLRVLDVPLALDHPQLQQGRAGLLSFPGLGCRQTGREHRGRQSRETVLELPVGGDRPGGQREPREPHSQLCTCRLSPSLRSARGPKATVVPFADLMVRCSTWCMADTVFSQAICGEEGALCPAT